MGIGCILVAYMQKGRVFGFILASKKKIFLKCIGLSETSLKHGKLSDSISRMDTLDVWKSCSLLRLKKKEDLVTDIMWLSVTTFLFNERRWKYEKDAAPPGYSSVRDFRSLKPPLLLILYPRGTTVQYYFAKRRHGQIMRPPRFPALILFL